MIKFRYIFLFFVFLLFSNQIYAQPQISELLNLPILDVKIEPEIEWINKNLLGNLIPGNILRNDDVTKTIHNLWNTGNINNIEIKGYPIGSGVGIIVKIEPQLKIINLKIKGNDHISDETIRETIQFEKGITITVDDLNLIENEVKNLYLIKGYPNMDIQTGITPTSDQQSIELSLNIKEGQPLRINKMYFSGNTTLSIWKIKEEMQLDEGDVFDQNLLVDDIENIKSYFRHSYYFNVDVSVQKSIPVENSKIDLYVHINTGNQFSFHFYGNRLVSDRKLFEILFPSNETKITRSIVKEFSHRIEQGLKYIGFYQAKVEDKILIGKKTTKIIFNVTEGKQLIVKKIIFKGNKFYSDDFLSDQILGTMEQKIGTSGILAPVYLNDAQGSGLSGVKNLSWKQSPPPDYIRDPDKLYVEDYYLEGIEHIKQLYESEGFFQTKISQPSLSLNKQKNNAQIEIDIDEGPQTIIQSITFMDNLAIKSDDLEKNLTIEIGGPLKRFEVEKTRRKLRELYLNEGYNYINVETQEIHYREENSVDIIFKFNEGPQVRIGEILIKGINNVSENLIRDQLVFESGDILRPDLLRTSEQNIIALGSIIQSASIDLVDPQESEIVKDIIVNTIESPPQFLEMRVGFSSNEGPRGTIMYGHKNLFGYAINFNTQAQMNYQLFFTEDTEIENLPVIDRLERHITAGIGTNHLPGLHKFLGINLDFIHERDNEPSYGLDRNSLYLTFSSLLISKLNLQLQFGVEFSVMDLYKELPLCKDLENEEQRPPYNCIQDNVDVNNLRLPKGDSTFFVTRLISNLDYRDNIANPTRGILGGFQLEYVYGIGSNQENDYNSNLIKLLVSLNGYIPLWSDKLVMALSAKWGRIFQLTNDSQTFADRMFYLGGSDTVRGFPDQSVNAWDLGEPGGNTMINFRAELRFPIMNSFWAGVFMDTGNIWRDVDKFDILAQRWSIGAGIRYQTSVATIVFDYGFLLNPQSIYNEGSGFPHFYIGLF